MMRAGTSTTDIAEMVEKTLAEFKCKAIENTLTVEIAKNEMEVEKYIMLNPSENQKREDFDIEDNEAYTINIQVSTGEGKVRQSEDSKTSVYRRNNDRSYDLKLKASRQVRIFSGYLADY